MNIGSPTIELPLKEITSFGGQIVVVETKELAQKACKYLSKCGIIGFDTYELI